MLNPAIQFHMGALVVGPNKFNNETILTANNEWIETGHGHIQWYFPLPDLSLYNENAPVLTEAEFDGIRTGELDGLDISAVKVSILAATNAFLRFLSFDIYPGAIYPNEFYVIFTPRAHWTTPRDHNLLRITRLLRCLTLIGEKERANRILDALYNLPELEFDNIGPLTYNYWKEAISNPLNRKTENVEPE